MKNYLKRIKKFTLIELIVVIVILGILAAIVVPNISSWQKEAEVTAVGSNVHNLQTSVDMYVLDSTKQFPAAGEQPVEFIPKPIDFELIHPDYTRNLPKTKGVKYWVDFKGKVWASTIDSPTGVDISLGNMTWNKIDDAIYYNVYQVEGYQGVIGAAYKSSSLNFVEKVETESYSGKAGVAYVVSAVDENGFETPPSGIGYEGYEKEKEDIVAPTPNPDPLPETPVELSVYKKVVYLDANNGSDENGDGTNEKPFKTVAKALPYLGDGSSLYFKKGTYQVDRFTDLISKYNVDYIGSGKDTVLQINYASRFGTNHKNKFFRMILSPSATYPNTGKSLISYPESQSTIDMEFHNIAFTDPYNRLIKTERHSGYIMFDASRSYANVYKNAKFINSISLGMPMATVWSDYNDQKVRPNVQIINSATNFKDIDCPNSECGDGYAHDYLVMNKILQNATIDANYQITSAGWKDTGIGQDKDGSIADIGVYGGKYGW